jgi:predicted MFS family arabinose efflux permease
VNAILARIGPPVRAVRGVIGNPSLRRAELAFGFFNLAEAATWVAILVFAFDRGGSAATGVVGMVLLIPAGVVAPVASTLGDRFRREALVRFGYAAQALAIAVTGVAMLLDAPDVVVYGLAAVGMATLTTGRPGHHSLLPDLARTPQELTAGNAVSALAEGVGGSLGTVVVAVLLAAAGAGWVYLVAAGALALGSALAFGVRSEAPDGDRATFRPLVILGEAVEGFRTIARTPSPRLLIALAAVMTVTWGAFDVLLVTLAIETLGIGEAGVGVLHTSMGIGAMLGAAGSVALVGRRSLLSAVLVAAALYGVSIAATGVAETAAIALASVFIAGVGVTLLDVIGRVLLQRIVDDAVLTRVFGVVESLWMAGVGVGSAVSAVLVSTVGVRTAFLIAGGALPLLTLAALGGLRRVDREAVVPERQLALLRGIAMFAPLPRSDIERVATQLRRYVIPRANDVVVEGEVGDTFYVIDAGTFEVSIGGGVVRDLGEGDHFGEIALLHEVPRTATVRARTDGAVWTLDRDAFLATVTGMPQAASAAAEVTASRLGEQRPTG